MKPFAFVVRKSLAWALASVVACLYIHAKAPLCFGMVGSWMGYTIALCELSGRLNKEA